MLRCLVSVGVIGLAVASEPNPPTWPSNVYVFDAGNPSYTQSVVDTVFAEQGGHVPSCNGQWSSDRYAFLFKPGTHAVDVNIGYYTTLHGAGKGPTDTTIGSVTCENGDYDYTIGALNNFWRSAENFHTTPTKGWNNNVAGMMWAVSQSSPLRQVSIDGNIYIWEYNSGQWAGYASGGWLSNSIVTGQISSGSQQQWISRNVRTGTWVGGVWNMVFVGCEGAPASHCGGTGGLPYTTIDSTPVIAEKPYIYIDGSGKYYLMKPPVETNKVGPTTNYDANEAIDFSSVYVATASDSAATINAKLAQGLHLVLSPGIYNLEKSLNVTKADTVVLGLGMATLIATTGQPSITVGNVDGVRIAGVLLQAGRTKSPSLLQVGSQKRAGDSSNPVVLSDVFARVGGTNDPNQYQVSAGMMIEINSGNTIVDNTWLWRADHGASGLVYKSDNPVYTGMQVNGDSVTAYGLKSEHTLSNLVEWNGNDGRTYFYQSEFPYDVTSDYANQGYGCYVVADDVSSHTAYGAGCYSYFRDYTVFVESAIQAPSSSKFVNPLTVFLDGYGGINHILNEQGGAVYKGNGQQWIC